MNDIEKQLIVGLLNEYFKNLKLKTKIKHEKKLKSERNKRYYQSHRDIILKKNKIKNELYRQYIEY